MRIPRKRSSHTAGVVLMSTMLGSVALLPGCTEQGTPEITAGIDACNTCNMVIDQLNQSCGFMRESRFVPFDSPACLLRAYQTLPPPDRPMAADIYFADYHDGILHESTRLSFLLTDHYQTVMNGNVICFGSHEAADSAHTHEDEIITDWPGYLTIRGEPDRTVEVTLGPDGMVPESVLVNKGEVIVWRVRGNSLQSDLAFNIKGYPEVGTIVVPVGGEEVEFRLLASRPGAGFPLLSSEAGQVLGQLKVTGAHTSDEEAM